MSIEEKLANYPGVSVVSQTGDQQYVLRLPDGTYQYLDEDSGYTSTDKEVVNNAMRSKVDEDTPTPAQMYQTKMAQDIVAQAPETAHTQKVIEGLPFVGSYADEVVEAIGGEEMGQSARILSEAQQIAHPNLSTAQKLTGGLLGGFGVAKGIEKGVPKLAETISSMPLAQRLTTTTALGGTGGSMEGAMYGYGEGEGAPSDSQFEVWRQRDKFPGSLNEYKTHFFKQHPTREQSAIEGGKWGAFGGSVGSTIGEALGGLSNQAIKGWDKLKTIFRASDKVDTRTVMQTIMQELNESADAAKVIKSAIDNDTDITTALEKLNQAGDMGMIADANVATAALTDASSQLGGGDIVEQQIKGRVKEEGARTTEQLETVLGKVPETDGMAMDVQDMILSINKVTAKERNDAYKKAYDHFIDYNSQAGRKIKSVLGRIDDDTMSKALKEANAELKYDNLPNYQVLIKIKPDGSIEYDKNLNVIQLDYIKRALQKHGQETVDYTPTPSAIRAQSLARDLRDAVADDNPAYKNALDMASDTISLRNALQTGEDIFRAKNKPRDIARALKGATESEKKMARYGLKTAVDTKIGDVKAILSESEIDITQIQVLWKDLSSKNMRDKIKLIVNKDEAGALFKQLDQLKIALNLKAVVAANSKTAIRETIKGEVEAVTEPGMIRSMLGGQPLEASKKATQRITGATQEFTEARRKDIFKDIARAMTTIKGADARSALKQIYDALKRGENINANLDRASVIIINNLPMMTISGGVTQRELNQEE